MKNISVAVASAACLFAAQLPAANPPELTARELYYVPAATAAPPAGKTVVTPPKSPATETKAPTAQRQKAARPKPRPAEPRTDTLPQEAEIVTVNNPAYEGPKPLGLRYSVLSVNGEDSKEVPVDTVFHSGDRVRIRVQANESAYLYVVTQGSSGNWQILFPSKAHPDNWVDAKRTYDLPGSGFAWTFNDQKGKEKLFVVLSRKEVGDLEKLIYDLEKKPTDGPAKVSTPGGANSEKRMMIAANIGAPDDQLVGRLRSNMLSRDLILEKVEKKEYALYAVDKSGKPGARLTVDVELKHE